MQITRNLRQVAVFFGSRLTLLAMGSIAVGISLFAIEVALALSLQTFLFSLAGTQNFTLSVGASVIGFAVIRGLVIWLNSFLSGFTFEQFKFLQRSRLATQILQDPTLNHASSNVNRSNFIFNELIQNASLAVLNLQSSVVAATNGFLLLSFVFWQLPRVSLVAATAALVCALPIRWLNRTIRLQSRSALQQSAKSNDRFQSIFKNLTLIRIYNLRERERQHLNALLSRNLETSSKLKAYVGLALAYPQTVAVIVLCFIASTFRADSGLIESGFISFIYLLYRILGQSSTLSFSVSSFYAGLPHLKSVYSLWLANQEPLNTRPPEIKLESPATQSETMGWVLNKVSYRYPESQAQPITELSAEIKPKTLVVLTGATGSGKSTLISLLLGELAPSSGDLKVTFGQTAITIEEARSALLESVGYVGPESLLFEGSVLENLLYGTSPGTLPTQQALNRALELADCRFLYDLNQGLNHRIADQGIGLSTGQKQKISFARALLRNPKILILDEASANFDQRSEEHFIETLLELKETTTIVLATHRKSFLRIADSHISLVEEKNLPEFYESSPRLHISGVSDTLL